MKIAVIYGGISTEHDVSIKSAKNVINNIDTNKYDVTPILIAKDGSWYKNGKLLKNIIEELKKVDVVFPILHGKFGEDGTVQGMLEMHKIPYVGCNVLASSICMDKIYTKIILDKAKIKQANYIYIKDENIYVDDEFEELELENDRIVELVEKKLGYPVFIKPSRSGSSIGIKKARNAQELIAGIQKAAEFDSKILVEEYVNGRELECAILNGKAIEVGEIVPGDDFYSYEAKYNNKESMVIVPAEIKTEIRNKIKYLAEKVFKVVDGTGLARIDFFLEDKTDELYINEINTMPGFTEISMYPKLCEAGNIKYKDLISNLIESAVK